MNSNLRNFATDYEMALIDYLNGGDEEVALQTAYELGRRAISGEQSILGLIGIHYRLVQTIKPQPNGTQPHGQTIARGEAFVTQVMALFEMTHRQTLEMNKSLRDSERRKAAIVGSAFDSIISFDANGRIIDFNPAAEQMFGRARAQVIGHDLA